MSIAESRPAPRVLHESHVEADEIDALGHMNVRFYGTRAMAATERLVGELAEATNGFGLAEGFVYDVPGLYTRYQREQHAGSPLVVRGGPIAVSDRGLRFHHELVNPERDERAASFVHDVILRRPGEAEPVFLPEASRKALAEALVASPAEGLARTVDLDAPVAGRSLGEMQAFDLAIRLPRVIEDDLCDGEGRVVADMRPLLMWGGDSIPPAPKNDGPPIHDLADGGRMGWAAAESRSVMLKQPRAGMRIQSFGVPVGLGAKTTHQRFWVFDLDTGDLLLANEVVDIALHLDQRRAIEIPHELRGPLEARLRPDLR